MDKSTGQRTSAQEEAVPIQEGGQSVERFDYRLLVGFLTETIDNCVRHNHLPRTRDAGVAEAVRNEYPDQIGIAMQALENTIRLILVELEIGEKSSNPSPRLTNVRNTSDWLRLVFPDTSAGNQLMSAFRKAHLSDPL